MSDFARITKFFSGDGTDENGRTLFDVLSMDDTALDKTHDVIQWMFPTSTPSRYNLQAPLVTPEVREVFRKYHHLRIALMACYWRFHDFLQLGTPHPWWVYARNHNVLRITRVLLSLNELGLPEVAAEFYTELRQVATRATRTTLWDDSRVWGYWDAAAQGKQFDPQGGRAWNSR